MIQFKKLIDALDQQNARYVIIGGLAAVIHGSAYITNDLDICYERSEKNLTSLVKALFPFHPQLRGPKEDNLPFLFDERTLKNGMNFTLKTDLGDIDLFGEIQGIGSYKQMIPNAEKMELFNHPCLIISLPDLILSKKSAGRKKDLLVLDELEALLEIRTKSKK
ncbi:MAG: hypothetical protein A3H42_05355 [Deltaproteobacteria bacterium RIFCSPLOWO2_02_FULL_46_8]|nr:MAG: hypothetical protein A3H42_05355 [Deltaproteobacteria bacterium RIFCSPLOWO2_02_FULL_46_8]